MSMTKIETELAELARLALQGSDRDVKMYVHRLAYTYRYTWLGERLAELDEVPPVSLR